MHLSDDCNLCSDPTQHMHLSVCPAWSQLFLESKECTLELASISRLCHPTRAQTLTQATSYNGTTAAAAQQLSSSSS